jgi:uncharacterized protein (TIGR02996 family)
MAQTHAEAFLQAILQDPDDDTPRLIFADWLEEQGDPLSSTRAEFIRVQCALAGGQAASRQRTSLERRQQQLLDEYGNEWARPVRRLARTWQFHRGFIDEVALWDDTFLTHADRLFRRTPIQHLRLCGRLSPVPVSIARLNPIPFSIAQSIHMAELADNEYLRRLRSLDLNSRGLESQHVRALVVSEHLTSLTALNLSHNRIGDSGIRALAASPLLGRLKRLDLQNNDIGAGGLRALTNALEELARSPEGLRLQLLELSHVNLSAAGQRVIAESPLLRRLTRG